jgi:hypothetical protein
MEVIQSEVEEVVGVWQTPLLNWVVRCIGGDKGVVEI